MCTLLNQDPAWSAQFPRMLVPAFVAPTKCTCDRATKSVRCLHFHAKSVVQNENRLQYSGVLLRVTVECMLFLEKIGWKVENYFFRNKGICDSCRALHFSSTSDLRDGATKPVTELYNAAS